VYKVEQVGAVNPEVKLDEEAFSELTKPEYAGDMVGIGSPNVTDGEEAVTFKVAFENVKVSVFVVAA
jgi:hypothetical protein